TLWPPNALLAGALLLAPATSWWWLLAAALPAHLLAELQSGVPTVMVLGWYVSNCSEALIAAALVRVFVPQPLRLASLRHAGMFLGCAVLAAPLLSSFLDAALVRIIGSGDNSYWDLVNKRASSNILAQLTVAPLVLTWAAVIARRPAMSLARLVEAAALFAGLLGVSMLVFDLPYLGTHVSPAVYYLPLPFLIWAALRLGAAGTRGALAVRVVATIWGAVRGLGPFAAHTPQETAHDMQLFLIAVSVPLLLLAVVLEERERAERESREQRRQLTHLSRVAMLGELSG